MSPPIDLDDPFTLVVVLVLGTTVMAALIHFGRLRRLARAVVAPRSWTEALRAVSDEAGLVFESVPTAYDRAEGDVATQRVTVDYTSVEGDAMLSMQLVVFGSSDFAMRAVGAKWNRNPYTALGARTKTGDPDFDALVEIYGAPEALFRIICDEPDLRALIVRVVVGVGATLADRHIVLVRERFASSADELRQALYPMIELGQQLEQPRPRSLVRGIGTELAVGVRRAALLRDDAQREAIAALLEPIAKRFGDEAAVEVSGEKREVTLRARKGGRALCLTVSSSLGVELRVHAGTDDDPLYLLGDRTALDTAGSKPVREGDDPSVPDYLGDNVYVEGRKQRRQERRARFEALTSELRARLIEAIPRLRIRYLRFKGEDAWLMFWPDLDEMLDPEGTLVEAADLLASVAAEAKG